MCGRYTLTSSADEVVETFDVPPVSFGYRPRFNIAPGQEAPVVAQDGRGRRLGLLHWGLVPSWSEEAGSGFINARGESVGETPSFRDAFVHRRCLVVADGFYEWRRDAEGKTPFLFRPARPGLVSFAGIWERWERPGHEPRFGFAILTVAANEEARGVHHRMPVVVAAADRAAWLDRRSRLELVYPLVATPPDGTFTLRRVSTRVNSPAVDEPSLVEAV
jgi:putative SOS response-associated peptidase YedK